MNVLRDDDRGLSQGPTCISMEPSLAINVADEPGVNPHEHRLAPHGMLRCDGRVQDR